MNTAEEKAIAEKGYRPNLRGSMLDDLASFCDGDLMDYVEHAANAYPLALAVVKAAEEYREAWTSSEDNAVLTRTREQFVDALDAWKAPA